MLAGVGINIDRLNGDLTAKAKEIDAILARNSAQAEAFEFRGTPSFIVGKFRVPGILTMAQFEQAAETRGVFEAEYCANSLP